MSNRILDVMVVNHRLDPHETELRVFVKAADITSTTEIRGKLMGPRCNYSSTIEIAYPLREVQRGDFVEMRVVIPEASWWEPETPFLYEGTLELWQDGAIAERAPIRHGIRTLQLTTKGLRLNGQPFALRGKIVEANLSDAEARDLRATGINAVLVPASESCIDVWSVADRLGLFVLGAAPELTPFLEHQHAITGHPSNFGWVFSRADFLAGPSDDGARAMLYGVSTSAASAPPNADFLVCHERELGWLDEVPLPKIVVTQELPQPLPRADVMGWIETA